MSKYKDACMYQFMKKLSNVEAELKNSVQKKACTYKRVKTQSKQINVWVHNFQHKTSSIFQKHPSRGVLTEMCSDTMQQIYRRIPMPKCDFNKVAEQLH